MRWRGGVDGGGGGVGKIGVDAAARRCHEGRGIMTWGIAKRCFSGGISKRCPLDKKSLIDPQSILFELMTKFRLV